MYQNIGENINGFVTLFLAFFILVTGILMLKFKEKLPTLDKKYSIIMIVGGAVLVLKFGLGIFLL